METKGRTIQSLIFLRESPPDNFFLRDASVEIDSFHDSDPAAFN